MFMIIVAIIIKPIGPRWREDRPSTAETEGLNPKP